MRKCKQDECGVKATKEVVASLINTFAKFAIIVDSVDKACHLVKNILDMFGM